MTNPIIPVERFQIFANGLDHPECLAFDRDGTLYAGGEAGQIYRIERDGAVQQIADLGAFNAGVAFSPAGHLIVCTPGRGLVSVERDGQWRVFATHAAAYKLVCPNYPVYDRAGNLYVTDSGQWMKRNGCVCRFTPDGNGKVVADGLGYANGLALSADESQLFMVESDSDSIFRFNMSASGSVSLPALFAQHVGRMPDGLALDASGRLYASCYASDDIHRITGDGKVELFAWDRWAIKLSRPTNLAFGVGDDDREYLYAANLGRTTITRANVGISGQPLANQI